MTAIASLVHQTSITTGTGDFTLAAVNGKQSFNSAFGNGVEEDVFYYFISNRSAVEWEEGTGHLSDATTLVRDTVKRSSNGNAAVSFSAGTKNVTCDLPADSQSLQDGFISGLTISNGSDITNDIDIAPGVALDTTGQHYIRLTDELTKRLDAAWAVGDGNGGLDTGAIANTTYHLWLIKRIDTNVVDVLFSENASAPTMPANYTFKAYIAPILRIAGAIKPFKQYKDLFKWTTHVDEVDVTANMAWALRAITAPLGIITRPILAGLVISTTGSAYVGVGDFTDTTEVSAHYVQTGNAGVTSADFSPSIVTNTLAQIHFVFNETTTARGLLFNYGFIHDLGRR